jgi:hypothetical protein
VSNRAIGQINIAEYGVLCKDGIDEIVFYSKDIAFLVPVLDKVEY